MIETQLPTRCPATTRKGTPCPIGPERSRSGYCHIHDPAREAKLAARRDRVAHLARDVRANLLGESP